MTGGLIVALALVSGALLVACRKIEMTQAEVREAEALHQRFYDSVVEREKIRTAREKADVCRELVEDLESPVGELLLARAASEYVPGGPSVFSIWLTKKAEAEAEEGAKA